MKLQNLITPFKVGLLVVLGVITAVFMVSVLKTEGGAGSDSLTVYAVFDDVTGLATKSRVQMAGIAVGTITKISLEDGRARVDMVVRRDLGLREGIKQETGLYKNGATVAKKQASFIGDYYLEITPGTEGPRLEDGDEIHNVVGAVGIDEMMERLNDIAGDIQEVTRSLATVFGGPEGRRNIQRMVNDLNNILGTLRTFVNDNQGKLDRILTNAEDITFEVRQLADTSGQSIGNILRDTEAVVQEVRYIIGQSSTDLQSGLGTLKGTLSRLQSTLDSLNYSLQNIQDITDKINEGEGTIGELVNNPTIAQRTEQLLTEAGDYVNRLSRLRTIIDLRTEYHVSNQALKNVLALRLQPTDDKYYLIELVDDFRGKTEVVDRAVSTNESGEDPVFTETEVRTTDSFKLSVQFARILQINSWMAVTGRFGLIESTGGVGGNLLLFPDRELQLQADIFDFESSVSPRFRAFATYEFLSFAYFLGGIDDAFNAERRDYIIGAGIRFDDEDLKAILTTTGVPTTGN